jgi:hypothetical protein
VRDLSQDNSGRESNLSFPEYKLEVFQYAFFRLLIDFAWMYCEDKTQNIHVHKEFTEFWTFSIVPYSKKHDVSETGSVSVLR